MSRTPKDALEGWGWILLLGVLAAFVYAMYDAGRLDDLYRDVTRFVGRLF
jgi:hypothetical protein